MFGRNVSANKGSEGFQINQRLRMSLKWQRIYEWRSKNEDIKATSSRQVAVGPWTKYSINQFGETDIPVRYGIYKQNPGHQKITPVVYLILKNIWNFGFKWQKSGQDCCFQSWYDKIFLRQNKCQNFSSHTSKTVPSNQMVRTLDLKLTDRGSLFSYVINRLDRVWLNMFL